MHQENIPQFSLKWTEYHSNLSRGLGMLLQTSDLADVTLACQGHYLKAHKLLLSLSSSYFNSLFQTNPCKHPIVILKDVKFSSLQFVLKFVYCGEVSVPHDELDSFLSTADGLCIKGLIASRSNQQVDRESDNLKTYAEHPQKAVVVQDLSCHHTTKLKRALTTPSPITSISKSAKRSKAGYQPGNPGCQAPSQYKMCTLQESFRQRESGNETVELAAIQALQPALFPASTTESGIETTELATIQALKPPQLTASYTESGNETTELATIQALQPTQLTASYTESDNETTELATIQALQPTQLTPSCTESGNETTELATIQALQPTQLTASYTESDNETTELATIQALQPTQLTPSCTESGNETTELATIRALQPTQLTASYTESDNETAELATIQALQPAQFPASTTESGIEMAGLANNQALTKPPDQSCEIQSDPDTDDESSVGPADSLIDCEEDSNEESHSISKDQLPNDGVVSCKAQPQAGSSKQDSENISQANNLHQCYLCDKTYNRKHLLTTHMRVIHFINQLSCNECSKMFTFLSSLKKHEISEHGKAKKISRSATTGKRNLNIQSKTERPSRKVKVLTQPVATVPKLPEQSDQSPRKLELMCEVCGKKFIYLGCLERHRINCGKL